MDCLFAPSYETISRRIRQVRGTMSQKEFGASIGITQTAVTALENALSEPRLSTFCKIVDAFGIDPEWLRTGWVAPAAVDPIAALVLPVLRLRKLNALAAQQATVLMEIEIIAAELGITL